jgi:hypothetical protein
LAAYLFKLSETMIVFLTAAALTGVLPADAFARGGGVISQRPGQFEYLDQEIFLKLKRNTWGRGLVF